ncbi:MAG: FecR domain-containing protein [Nitrospirae bacterium]|nr:FecR domain-containing protein [Nitrospirota bacterium]
MTHRNIIAILLLAAFSFSIAAPVSAQSIAVLGEVKANGKVFLEATGGQWLSAPATYPLLQNTGIRTDDGSASLHFKDGSRIDISKNALAVIDGSSGQYTVHMSKGTLAFNIAPGASLFVQTASATVSVNMKNSVVQKVSLEKSGRVLGVISATDKGTEVRSISGRIAIEVTPTETKLISSGEGIFVDAGSTYKVYNTQALTSDKTDDGSKKGGSDGTSGSSGETLTAGIIGGVFLATAGIMSLDVWRGSGRRIASPSAP